MPVVGFNIPIFSDFLHNYPAKDLLVKKNPEELSVALEKLITNPKRIESIKKWCIAMRPNFSWNTIARQTEEVYQRILNVK